jgi:site-specific DNA recombinase
MNRTAARSVTVIPPTINPLTHLSKVAIQKRRVAGYARVSTDSDEQFTSYEAQVDYYTQYIKRNPEWEFVRFTPTRAFPARTPSIVSALMK